jgi:uncharacterized membrane protein YgaE (UPF0421/DUF939 family)
MIHDAYFECINDENCEQRNLINDSYSTILDQKALYLESTANDNAEATLSDVEEKLDSLDTIE